MLIEWFAHSCFMLCSQDGVKLLIDPYDDTTGYPMHKFEADAVLSTHDHFDHNCFASVTDGYVKINSPGEYNVGGVSVSGYRAYHDDARGAKRGESVVYKIVVDGVVICHMGDIGHLPSDDLYEALGKVDVLMIPVGGYFTIDAADALKIIDRMEPNMILPMHYLTDRIDWPIAPLSVFLDSVKQHYDVSHMGKSSVSVIKNDLKKRTRVIVLDYAL